MAERQPVNDAPGVPGAPDALDVLTLGETMALLIADEPGPLAGVRHFTRGLAGADTNVAIGLARLGLKVGWISRVGDDAFGAYVRAAVAAEGVDTSTVEVDPQRSTGLMLKARAAPGQDPATEYYRRGSAASVMGRAHFNAAYVQRARHFHATGVAPALSPALADLVEHTMGTLRAAGRTVSFDPNLRPRLWPDAATMRDTLNRLARQAHWVLPGIEEGRLLTGHDSAADIAGFYLAQGAEAVVVKLGPAGAYVRTATEALTVPGVQVPVVVDTVGAGDGFAVGVVSARLEGLGWDRALARGNWIAAQAIQVLGDMDGLPRRADLPSGL